MLKLKQAELEEIKEVRKSVFGDADFDDEGLCLHVLARDGDEKGGMRFVEKGRRFRPYLRVGSKRKPAWKNDGRGVA